MHIVAVAWIYVAGMAALAEALSPQGTLLGALFTFVLYGALPLALVLYVMATPARKQALRRARADEERHAAEGAEAATLGSTLDPDRRGHAPAGAAAAPVAAKREEP